MQRVFISSVMRGFERERDAARAAVESLRQHPVMAETFGAKPYSSEVACLEGVRASDVYVGIFGERYGWVTPAGVSVTEEEFNEARRTGKPILCFVQEGPKEAEQEAFLRRIKDYREGYFVDAFTTTEDLTRKIVRALHDHIGQPGVARLDAHGAARHGDAHAWGSRPPPQFGTWLGALVFPARVGEQLIPVVDLGRRALQDNLLQPALFGASAVLVRELGVETVDGEQHLVFQQQVDRYEPRRRLEVHSDGTLVFGAALGAEDRRSDSMIRSYLVDRDEVQALLTAFTAYARAFYDQLERGAVLSEFYIGTSLTGIGRRYLGRMPSAEPNSITVPDHGLDDPLHVPRQPMRVARADLGQPEHVAEQLVELMVRTFRAARGYYLPAR